MRNKRQAKRAYVGLQLKICQCVGLGCGEVNDTFIFDLGMLSQEEMDQTWLGQRSVKLDFYQKPKNDQVCTEDIFGRIFMDVDDDDDDFRQCDT